MPRSKSRQLAVGLLGYGAIGSEVARYIEAEKLAGVFLTGIYDPAVLHPTLGKQSLQELIDTGPDIIVEAAGHSALFQSAAAILTAGIDLLVVSVGALCSEELFKELVKAPKNKPGKNKHSKNKHSKNKPSKNKPGKIFLTTGAIGGIDILSAARMAGDLESASLTSIKPPGNFSLATAEPVVVFEGTVREAAQRYPESANVCAALGFATLGLDKATAMLIANPDADAVTHQIFLKGTAGEYEFSFSNKPSDKNPKTSAVVPFAVLRGLKDLSWMRAGGEFDRDADSTELHFL